VGASSDVTVGYMGLWGGVYGGFAYSTSVLNTVSAAYYWSSTAYGRDLGHYLIFDVTGAVYPQYTDYKLYGLQVRCVN
jgi:hypothetical protein